MLPDEVIGPVWIDYAEVLLIVNRPKEALDALQEAMNTSGPASTAARYRVARWLIDSRLHVGCPTSSQARCCARHHSRLRLVFGLKARRHEVDAHP